MSPPRIGGDRNAESDVVKERTERDRPECGQHGVGLHEDAQLQVAEEVCAGDEAGGDAAIADVASAARFERHAGPAEPSTEVERLVGAAAEALGVVEDRNPQPVAGRSGLVYRDIEKAQIDAEVPIYGAAAESGLDSNDSAYGAERSRSSEAAIGGQIDEVGPAPSGCRRVESGRSEQVTHSGRSGCGELFDRLRRRAACAVAEQQ